MITRRIRLGVALLSLTAALAATAPAGAASGATSSTGVSATGKASFAGPIFCLRLFDCGPSFDSAS